MEGERWRRGGQQRRVRIPTENENEIEIENDFKRWRRGDPQRVGTPEDLLIKIPAVTRTRTDSVFRLKKQCSNSHKLTRIRSLRERVSDEDSASYSKLYEITSECVGGCSSVCLDSLSTYAIGLDV